MLEMLENEICKLESENRRLENLLIYALQGLIEDDQEQAIIYMKDTMGMTDAEIGKYLGGI